MSNSAHIDLQGFMAGLERRNPGETEYHQAVYEVAADVLDYIEGKELYHRMEIMRRLVEPDRVIAFRVCWEDDEGHIRVNRGYRVQHNNAIGPYKGGIRFHKSVSLSILKFLAFEQTFKNSLTDLPLGGGKGGADFNPKGKSDREIMRFCQSYMTELYRHVSDDTDVPAGDIGVGDREIGYLFGQYKRLTNRFTGVLTGKGLEYGGSPIRKEATGYGVVYMMQHMLERRGESIAGKTCVLSGAGNVSRHAAEKLIELDAKVVTMSDSGGFIHDKGGLDADELARIAEFKANGRGSLASFAEKHGVHYYEGERPWGIACDLAFPCATQNEVSRVDARRLIGNGCIGIAEGANMPVEQDGKRDFIDSEVLFAPSKAANAGGVALSGLEMAQNRMRTTWDRDALNARLCDTMKSIHDKCVEYGARRDSRYIDYVRGANIAGFIKVADAMLAFGIV